MRTLTCALMMCIGMTAHAQQRLSDHNQILWLSTIITPTISAKVSGHIEYQWRRADWLQLWQQSLLRVGINYKASNDLTLHAGYAWIITYPYGDYPLSAIAKPFPEHRLYEQLVVSSKVGKANLLHRLRLEQRWLGRYTNNNSTKPNEFVFLNRLRYMPRVDLPLSNNWYTALYDEIFIGFGKNVGENVFDQNRFSILFGKKFTTNFRAEAGWLNQVVQLGREIEGKNAFQYNNGVIVNTYFNF